MDVTQIETSPRRPMVVARKSWRAAAKQVLLTCGVVVICATILSATFLLFAVENFDVTVGEIDEHIAHLGASALGELGNGLAVTASIQFGVLIALVSRQIDTGRANDEVSLREALSYLAELPVVLLAPAVLLATISGIMNYGDGLGALLVILPVFAAQIGMSIAIATFEIADASTLATRYAKSAAKALQDLRTLNRLPTTTRFQFLAWTTAVSIALPAIGAGSLLFWRPDSPEDLLAVVLMSALMALIIAGTLLAVAAENSSLKPRKNWRVVAPFRFLYIGLLPSLAWISLLGLFYYPPFGVASVLALAFAVYVIRQSWREAASAREGRQSVGYDWWRGGMIMRFGTQWARAEACTSLRGARAAVARYTSDGDQ